ncbi:3-hydroxyisobutyrate dehydrogenase [Pedobacter quisquiliarum]|uniref:3-hydroxyisobutyrate dehydrogenase n=1 Tax=Pedobacter quisquiliarum TaxID=1834438 RepID=A0A916UKB7_9SPHI|nr:NAD(P)-binding domain-containing protein [Pedobacter quisquiliarum]GGC74075.1 3-hydroxyisobutyrate dehydrogenase [Pedobacter quisquiliarum]
MKIGIIGSGNIGTALVHHLTRLGHEVKIANSRGPETLQEIAAETGATAVTAEQAASAEDLVIITIPEKAIPELPISVLSASKAVIVDTGNYYPTRDGNLEDIAAGTPDSTWVASVIGHPVVKAFNNIFAASLAEKGTPAGTQDRIALSVAGDDESQKQVVMQLIDDIGFDAIDGGQLSESWRQEPGTPAYCHDLDKAALKAALESADLSKRAENRAAADEQARAFF